MLLGFQLLAALMRQPGMSISTGEKELEFADPKEEARYWRQVSEDLERKLVIFMVLSSMTILQF